MDVSRVIVTQAIVTQAIRGLSLCALLALGACADSSNFAPVEYVGGTAGQVGSTTVARGETLMAVSRRTGVPLRDLIEANDLSPPFVLHPGQTLNLPARRYHLVQKGDTLYSIARTYRVDRSSLVAENNLTAPYTVKLGTRLRIPASVEPASAAIAGTDSPPVVMSAPPPASAPVIAASGGISAAPLPPPSPAPAPNQQALAAQPPIPSTPSPSMPSPPTPEQDTQVSDLPVPLPSLRPGTTQVAEAPAAAEPVEPDPDSLPPPKTATGEANSDIAIPRVERRPQQVAVAQPVKVSSPAPEPEPAPAPKNESKPSQSAALPPPPARSGKSFSWPVAGSILSSYGSKPGGTYNEGLNIQAPEGTTVRAAEAGVVAYAGNEIRGYGNLILIRHDGGWMTAYGHNQALLVKKGEIVRRGQPVARVGHTGAVSVPQLHFEIRKSGDSVDPQKYLARSTAGG